MLVVVRHDEPRAAGTKREATPGAIGHRLEHRVRREVGHLNRRRNRRRQRRDDRRRRARRAVSQAEQRAGTHRDEADRENRHPHSDGGAPPRFPRFDRNARPAVAVGSPSGLDLLANDVPPPLTRHGTPRRSLPLRRQRGAWRSRDCIHTHWRSRRAARLPNSAATMQSAGRWADFRELRRAGR